MDMMPQHSEPLHIAIDGPAGAGKSTVAAQVAARFGIPYLDTGGMYRTAALFCLRRGVDLNQEAQVEAALQDMTMTMEPSIPMRFFLDGEDVTGLIRTDAVAMGASTIARYPSVRRYMVVRQQAFAARNSVVAEGRDIGTVVLPDAAVKVFLTASVEERGRRRLKETAGAAALADTTALAAMVAEIARRDAQDESRADSPLRAAADARIIDSTALSQNQVVNEVASLARAAMTRRSAGAIRPMGTDAQPRA